MSKSSWICCKVSIMNHKFYRFVLKRVLDIVIALLVIALLWPLALAIAALIRLESPGPVIFKQERIGKDEKVFKIWKFRSMYQNAEHTGSGVYSGKGDPRVTKIGRIIRATSIDELPQVWNLLIGEMSLIGPRPPLTYHPWSIEEYTEEQKKMFAVRPGITGWAQVHGRREVEWHERIRLNIWYVEHMSLRLDIQIFFLTIYKVLGNKNNSNVSATVVPPVQTDVVENYVQK